MLLVLASITVSFAQPKDASDPEESYGVESLSPERNLLLIVNDVYFNAAEAPSTTSFTLDALTMYHLTIGNTSRITRHLRFGRNFVSGGYTDNLFGDTTLSVFDLEQPRVPIIVTSELVELALPPGRSFQLQFRLSREKLGTWELRDFGSNYRAGAAVILRVN